MALFSHKGHLRMGGGKTGALPSLEERHAAFYNAMVTEYMFGMGNP